MTRVALVFPGQGSQAAGMGADLLEVAPAPELLDVAAAAGIDLGTALAGDEEGLRPTEIAQPALLLVESVLASRVMATSGVEVVGVAGHSVGEYAALVAAGVLEPAVAMRLVAARGRAMAAMREGGMTALLGATEDVATAICAEVGASGAGVVVVANLNGPGQVVISGDRAALEAAAALAKERGVRRAMPLRVSGAFHSPLMSAAAEEVGALIDAAPLAPAAVPVVCNVDAEAVREPDALRDRLRRQLASPVRWSDCVATLAGLGAEVLVEVGPGSVLSGLAGRIDPGLRTLQVASAAAAAGLGDALTAATRG
ncbi:MAG TPA: ACP S-malonyltransferase [Candidatus Dormibacteraeota bacterium]